MQILNNYIWEKNGRRENEDAIGIRQYTCKKYSCGIAIVCDGIGGLEQGETASSFVAQFMLNAMDKLIRKGNDRKIYIRNYFFQQIYRAHQKLIHYGREQNIRLGTTICMVVWMRDNLYLFQIGDSNAYIGRKSLRLCTNRHRSLKNQLSQAVGVGEYRTPFYQIFRLKKGMKILLCTDGFDRRAGKYIHNLKSEKQIYHIYHFVQEQGEKDNISCIYLEWTKEEKHGR